MYNVLKVSAIYKNSSDLADLHNITLSQQMTMMTMRSNDTLVDTPFQLISGFFHVNQGVLCSEHAEQASCRGVLEGGNRLAKLYKDGEQQAS